MSDQVHGEPAPRPRKRHRHLSPEEADELRAEREDGWPFDLIAKHFGVSYQTAVNICRTPRKRDVKAAEKAAAGATPAAP